MMNTKVQEAFSFVLLCAHSAGLVSPEIASFVNPE